MTRNMEATISLNRIIRPGPRLRNHRWATILAGGDGSRLRALTRSVSGDDRPKQFCPFLWGQTPLELTTARVARVLSPDRTLYVLSRRHESHYSQQLVGVPSSRQVVQDVDRGTLPAIMSSLACIVSQDPDAVVAFLPSDHFYQNEAKFLDGLNRAFEAAETSPDSVILLGTTARLPEPSFGYIEPVAAFRPVREGHLRSVRRFWEKPEPQLTQQLVDRGCLWNTFVMVARAQSFLKMIKAAVPATYSAFRPLFSAGSPHQTLLEQIYRHIRPSDFSKRVLSSGRNLTLASPLAVLNLGDI